MKASWYERQGAARDVLEVGEMETPHPGPDEVRFRVAVSGINPGDVKKRANEYKVGMPYPRVIPHSDGAGVVDMVGANVSPEWIGSRIWCFGAQSYRPFGTAAEFCVVPVANAVKAPPSMSFVQGACLGISGLTAHRAVHVAGGVEGKTVLVQGGAGAVGLCAVQLACRAGARVIATVRRPDDVQMAKAAGATVVVLRDSSTVREITRASPDGVDHIVEVAFAENIAIDLEVLRSGGTIATFATGHDNPTIPFWPLVFQNVGIFFLGSDDFSLTDKRSAADAINAAFDAGWAGFPSVQTLPLEEIASAHERVESRDTRSRVVLEL